VNALTPARDAVDHLLLGVADRDAGIEWLERQTGVRAAIGGSHPGRGTRNALLSLGGRQYLEILAPDPAQARTIERPDLAGLTTPRLITWAAVATDLEALGRQARAAGQPFEGPRDGSRARPDGLVLRWRTLEPAARLPLNNINPIPFFIQWADVAAHPSQDSPVGCELLAVEIEHPNPEQVSETLQAFGIDARVRLAGAAVLRARLSTPHGIVELG
jgi:hypothetical protein